MFFLYENCYYDFVVHVSDYLCMHPANITAHFNMFTCPLIEESLSTKTDNKRVKNGSGESTKGTISLFLLKKI